MNGSVAAVEQVVPSKPMEKEQTTYSRCMIFRRLVAALALTIEAQKRLFGLVYDDWRECLVDDLAFMPPTVRKALVAVAGQEVNRSDLQLLRETMRSERPALVMSRDRWAKLFTTERTHPVLTFSELFEQPYVPKLAAVIQETESATSDDEPEESRGSCHEPAVDIREGPVPGYNGGWKTIQSPYEVELESGGHGEEAAPGPEEERANPAESASEGNEAPVADVTAAAQTGIAQGSREPVPGKNSSVAVRRRRYVEVEKIPDDVLEGIFKDKPSLDACLMRLCLAKGVSPETLSKRASEFEPMSASYFSVFISTSGGFRPSEDRFTAAAIVLGLDEKYTGHLLDTLKTFEPIKREKPTSRRKKPSDDPKGKQAKKDGGDSLENCANVLAAFKFICRNHGGKWRVVVGRTDSKDQASVFRAAFKVMAAFKLSREEAKYTMSCFAGRQTICLELTGDAGDLIAVLAAVKTSSVKVEII